MRPNCCDITTSVLCADCPREPAIEAYKLFRKERRRREEAEQIVSELREAMAGKFKKMDDQIAALRSVIASSQDAHLKYRGETDADLERLRAALQSIANKCPATCDMTLAHEMAQEAEEALK